MGMKKIVKGMIMAMDSRGWLIACHDLENRRQRITIDIAYQLAKLDPKKDRFMLPWCWIMIRQEPEGSGPKLWSPSETTLDGDHQVLYFGISAHLNCFE